MNAHNCPVAIALSLRAVEKRYGAQLALRGVSLDLAAGETLALVGHNGAGKTTLMKLVLGLTQASAGSIEGAGLHARGSLGYLPEVAVFPASISGRDMLRFYARLKRCPATEVDTLLELVGLADAARRRIGTYSKGMRQRLGLAQALLGDPGLLLLDEPTSGMDPFLRRHFYDILGERCLRGTAVLLASHALTEIEARASRIAILGRGELLAEGSLPALRARAGLPVALQLSLSGPASAELLERLAGYEQGQATPGKLWVNCPAEHKMALLRAVSSCPEVADITLQPPGLDALYAHFCGERES